MFEITPQDKDAFQRDGAIIIRQAFTRQWLDIVEQGILENMAQPSDHGRYSDPDTKTFFQDSDNWRRIAPIETFAFESPAKEIAAMLLGSGKINFLHDHVLSKMPGASQRTLWHQDQPYSPVDGDDFCTLWLPVDSVTRETALEFVAGSHRWGKWFRPQWFATGQLRDGDDERWEILPDIEARRGDYRIIGWALEPGDCLVFHGLTLHGAAGNFQATPRRVLSTRWTGDDAVFRYRRGKMSPPAPLHDAPRDGAVMDCPAFPVVWRAGLDASRP
ncbi:phytanoyl-CoA dioxygenase family protein [Acerihabitans arboris]|uniref:Mitomycin antibiotic biosynthesis protein n=1 Tax=Acerihabitans arboris TaxID=2691583 RepID=A0A845SFG9_9GAMM|nr:phytanoyl-CoA dioxygenase family protein [Acerihabitans arboris]NDL62142.1 mitomycin antibiotic biosynthesis protein [Acerihabitans arboris]